MEDGHFVRLWSVAGDFAGYAFWIAQPPDCPIVPALNATDLQGDYQLLISDRVAVNIEADLDGLAIKVGGDSSLNSTKGAEL